MPREVEQWSRGLSVDRCAMVSAREHDDVETRLSSRPVWRWWGRCGLAGLFFVLLLARSGGGLGPSSLCGQVNDLFVLGTVVCALAAGVFFVIALGSTVGSLLAAVSGVLPKGAVAVAEPAPPPLYSAPPTPVDAGVAQRSPLWRWLPAAAVVGAALLILAVPSGCVPF